MVWARRQKGKSRLPEISLDGFRVYVRPPRIEDWQSWSNVREENRARLMPFEPKWPEGALSQDFFMRRLSRQTRNWQMDQGYAFLIFAQDTHEVIGGINVNNVCRGAAQYASLGYWLDYKHQGAGYMTEALRLVINYAFSELHLHRLHASCLPHNKPSMNVLKRLGFAEEGFAKKYLEIGGSWQDHVLFGLVADDWREKQKPVYQDL